MLQTLDSSASAQQSLLLSNNHSDFCFRHMENLDKQPKTRKLSQKSGFYNTTPKTHESSR